MRHYHNQIHDMVTASQNSYPCQLFRVSRSLAASNDAKAETPVLWPLHAKSWLIGKDSDAGKDWGKEEKGTTEDEMALLTQWTWVWVTSGSWWWTGRPAVLRFLGLQRVGHNWETELNWIEDTAHAWN